MKVILFLKIFKKFLLIIIYFVILLKKKKSIESAKSLIDYTNKNNIILEINEKDIIRCNPFFYILLRGITVKF